MPKYFAFNPHFFNKHRYICDILQCEQMLMGQPVKWYDPLSSIMFFFLVIFPDLYITDLVQFQMTISEKLSDKYVSHSAQCDSSRIQENVT